MDASTDATPEYIRTILPQTLKRLTAGLPRHELDLIYKEATACEFGLKKEIELLEAKLTGERGNSKTNGTSNGDSIHENFGLQEPTMISIPTLPLQYQPGGGGTDGVGNKNYLSSADEILSTEFTPLDRYFTISAVMGRLKDPLKLPPPNSVALGAEETETMVKKRKIMLDKQQALLDLENNPIYHKEHADSSILLNLWKRISSHRTAIVFRKPVNPAEGKNVILDLSTYIYIFLQCTLDFTGEILAPGYKERISFPIDLSLIRKFITSRVIKSYKALHQRIGLVCHNCVKFNGR